MKINEIIWAILGAFILFFLFYTCNEVRSYKKISLQNYAIMDSIIREQRDSFGVFREFMGKVVTKEILENSMNSNIVEIRKSVQNLGYEVKDIRAILKLNLISTGDLDGRLIPILNALDSLQGDTLNYTNVIDWDGLFNNLTKKYAVVYDSKNLNFKGDFDISTGITKGDYKYETELLLVSSWKKRFLKSDYSTIGIHADDPNAEITLSSYTIAPPKNLFDISLQLGYGFNLDGLKIERSPYIGLGISKKIFSINKK